MKAFAQILVALAPFLLAGIIPFKRVLRGGQNWSAFAIAWVSLIGWMAIFCFLIPAVAHVISPDFGRDLGMNWMPEGPAVVGVAVMGWLYAGTVVLLALLARRLRNQSSG